ncbi:MAG: hypothetical protein Q4E75_03725 [bacterium]|nr:hypothetical protein [bacterium]
MNGPQISNLYKISYYNDGVSDHYIKITTSNTKTVTAIEENLSLKTI